MTTHRIPGFALMRLMWRPAAPTMVFPVFLATVYPLLNTVGGPASVSAAMSSGFATLPLRAAFWMGCASVPATVGAIMGFVMREPLHSPMGWMLPRYARRLSPPMSVIAILTSLVVSIPIARVSNSAVTLAAFCICLFTFSCGWVMFDPAASSWHRWASAILLLLMLFRPTYSVNATEAHPLYFGIAALAVALFSAGLMSKDVVRVRALVPSTAGRMGWIAWFLDPREVPLARSRGSRVDSLSLLRAGLFETHGALRFSYAGSLLSTVIVVLAMGLLTGSSGTLMMIMLFSLGMSGSHLKNAFPYPVSRGRRAKAFLISSVFDNVAVTSTALAAVFLVLTLGFWRTDPDRLADTPTNAIAIILSLALCAPIAQAAMVPGFSLSQKGVAVKKKIIAFGSVLLWIIVAGLLALIVRRAPNRALGFQWVAYIVAFALIQTAFWVYLRWYFSKKDLF